MRSTITLLLVFCGFTLCCVPERSLADAPQARALLVGVNGYDKHNGGFVPFVDINTTPDVLALQNVLSQPPFRLAPEQIRVLKTPVETKHKTIIDSFRHFLIEPTQPGDTVYFHFSGHGFQVPSPHNKNVLESTLVPSDYSFDPQKPTFEQKVDGSNDIRFSELAGLLEELKKKKPAHIVITLDSSHSGGFEPATQEITLLKTGQGWQALATGSGQGFVLISASTSSGEAYETWDKQGKPMGLFSYALAKALRETGPQSTYRDLFDRLDDIMRREKPFTEGTVDDPEIVGDFDRMLFSDKEIVPDPYVPVIAVQSEHNLYTLKLEAGDLQGMTSHSRFALYARGTKRFHGASPVAIAEVSAVGVTESGLVLEPGHEGKVKLEDLDGCRAIELQHKFGEDRLRVDIGPIAKSPVLKSVVVQLLQWPFVAVSDMPNANPQIRLRPEKADKEIRVEHPDGTLLASVPEGKDQANILKQILQRVTRWQRVRALQNGAAPSPLEVGTSVFPIHEIDTLVKVEMRIVPVEIQQDRPGVVRVVRDRPLPPSSGGLLDLTPGDYVMVEVRNTGASAAYCSVLNLRSDGTIQPVWTPSSYAHSTARLPPGNRWYRLPIVLDIAEPYGVNVLKAIATHEPIDFRSFFGLPGLTAARPMEDRIAQEARALPRLDRCGPVTIVRRYWSTYDLAYRVVPTANSLHILAVGVSKPGVKADADFAAADAQSVAESLAARSKALYGHVTSIVLTDQATRAAIESAFAKVAAEARPQDTFVFYFGGPYALSQGVGAKPPELTLLPAGVTGTEPDLASKGISASVLRAWTAKVPAQKQMLVLDTGSPDRAFRDFARQATTEEDTALKDFLSRQTLLMGSVGQRVLQRGSRHGPLAEAMLHGIAGEAAPPESAGGKLTAYQLEAYVNSKLLELSHQSQRLHSDGVGDDFPVEPILAAPIKPVSEKRGTQLVSNTELPAYKRQDKDYALLIGTSQYDHFSALHNPLNDVNAIAAELRNNYGFRSVDGNDSVDGKGMVLANPTKKDVTNAIVRCLAQVDAQGKPLFDALNKPIKRQYEPDDQLLIFIAGHGDFNMLSGRGVLICKDTDPNDIVDDTYITHDNLKRLLNQIDCRHILLVMDACYSGVFATELRDPRAQGRSDNISDRELVRQLMKIKSRLFLTSGGKETVKDAGDTGDHSPFAQRFLEALQAGAASGHLLRMTDILAHVEKVHVDKGETLPRSGPWGDNQDGGNFLFIPVSR